MKKENSEYKDLQLEFKDYLKIRFPLYKDIQSIVSSSLYPWRYDIGIEFFSIFSDKKGLEKAQVLLEKHFREVKNHQHPKQNAILFKRTLRILKEFFDEKYSGINGYIASQKTNTNKVLIQPTLEKNQSRRNKEKNKIPRPTREEVSKLSQAYTDNERFYHEKRALEKLFFDTYPKNSDIDEIMIKVSALNDFFRTKIFNTHLVAKHIHSLKIDKRLDVCDPSLVNDISLIQTGNERTKNFYSFATKYCSHHKPLDYPICDYYVMVVLKYFRDTDNFASFTDEDIKDYVTFKKIVQQFREFYGLSMFSFKEIDRYLWETGSYYFPRTYGKKSKSE